MKLLTRFLYICVLLFATDALAQGGSDGGSAPGITGTGSVNVVPLFGSTTSIFNSNIFQANGNIGIGNSNPQFQLDILGFSQSQPGIGLRLFNTSGVSESASLTSILFAGGDVPSGYAMIQAGGLNFSGGNGYLSFQTAVAGVLSENMRIDSGGLVAIGEPYAQNVLSLSGGMNIDQEDNDNGVNSLGSGNNSSWGLSFGFSSGEGISSVRSPGPNQYGLDFYTGFSKRMSITQTGSVGIGTTTPSQTLEVNGSAKIDGAVSASAIIFPDGSSLNTTSNLLIQNPQNSFVNIQSTAPTGGDYGAGLQLTGNARQWSIVSWNSGNGGIYPGSLGIADSTANVVRQLFDPSGDVYIGLKTGDGSINSASLTTLANGNVGIGTVTPGSDLSGLAVPPSPSTPILEINGDIALTQNNGGQVIFSDGTVQSTAWNGTTLGGDYAESVDVLGERDSYEPGDVIVIDSTQNGRFDRSAEPYSKLVAGVYSTKPGLVGRRTTTDRPAKESEVPMAMMGIVPTKVSAENGPIERGDLLVSSSTPGYAMKGTDSSRMMGAVIGKALAPLKTGSGIVEVLISLQ